MREHFNSILKHTSIYSIGEILARGLGFFLLPFYTRYIIPAEYGIMALVDLTGYFVAAALSFGITTAMSRYYSESQDSEKKTLVVSTAMLLALLIGSITVAALQLFASIICRSILGSNEYTYLFRLLFASIGFSMCYDVFLSYLRVEEKSALFVSVETSRTLIMLFLNIYFIAFLQKGILGIFLSTTITTGLFAFGGILYIFRNTGYQYSFKYSKSLLLFGLPLIPSSIFELVLHFSDKFYLKQFGSLTDVGIYSVAYKFGMILAILVGVPFRLMWSAKLFSVLKAAEGPRVQSRLLTYMLFILLFLGLCLSIMSKEIVYLFTNKEYYLASKIIPFITFGYVFFCLNWIFKGGFLINNRTGLVSISCFAGAVVNLFLNYLLIRPYGIYGAAISTIISYFMFDVILLYAGNRYFPIKYEFSRVTKLISTAVIIYMVSDYIDMEIGLLSTVIKGVLILAFPTVLHLVGFYKEEEIQVISKYLSGLRLKIADMFG